MAQMEIKLTRDEVEHFISESVGDRFHLTCAQRRRTESPGGAGLFIEWLDDGGVRICMNDSTGVPTETQSLPWQEE